MTSLIRSVQKMRENNRLLGNIFSVGRGVVSGANDFFFINDLEETEDPEEALVRTGEGRKIRIEKEVLAPLVRGRNIDAWNYEIENFIIWTHDENGEVRSDLPPRAKNYFETQDVRKKLEDRRTSSISRKLEKGAPVWLIGDVSAKKLKNKVAWQKIAHSIESTYLPAEVETEVGMKKLIINSSVNFIEANGEVSALSLTGILNSTPARAYVASYVNRTGAADCQHFAWILGCLPIPKKVEEGETKELAEIARKLQEAGEEEPELTKELNNEVARLYGFSKKELSKMEDFLEFFTED